MCWYSVNAAYLFILLLLPFSLLGDANSCIKVTSNDGNGYWYHVNGVTAFNIEECSDHFHVWDGNITYVAYIYIYIWSSAVFHKAQKASDDLGHYIPWDASGIPFIYYVTWIDFP